jgi:hypothetical protein
MMKEIKAPSKWHLDYRVPHIFLAGSIEMGVADHWQTKLVHECRHFDVTFLNPRRDHWDASWEQSIDNPQFTEQVNWELNSIERSDVVAFYFDPNTKSPITLMELGYVLGYMPHTRQKIFVCCPEGFWRRGNIEVMCDRAGVQLFESLDGLIGALHREILDI